MNYEDDKLSKKLMPSLDWIMLVSSVVFVALKQYWPGLLCLALLATLVVISELTKEPEVDLDPLWQEINDLKAHNAEIKQFCEDTKSDVTKMNLAVGIKGLGK